MAFPGLLGAVAVAGEDLVPVDAPPRPLDGGEDALDVHRPVPNRLGRVVHDQLPKVIGVAERVGNEGPDVHEVVEIAELIELPEVVRGFHRQRVVIPASDLEQSLGTQSGL